MNVLIYLQRIRNPILDRIMVFTTRLGDAGVFWISIGMILYFTGTYRKCGAEIILSILISSFIGNIVLKNIFSRKRPCWINKDVNMLIRVPRDYSFPSGHTSASFAAATSIIINFRFLGVIALIIASLIGFSRMYLFVHYLSDVLIGAILGIACGVITFMII